MRTCIHPFLLIVILAGLFCPAGVGAVEEKPLDVSSVVATDEKTRSELDEAVAGDKKEFQIRTDENISTLEIGDLYRNDLKTFFKVVSIGAKAANGGSFVVQRTNGATEPGQRFQRVAGSGPATITARLTLIDLYLQGGAALHPIAVLGLVTIVLTVNCLWIFRRRRQIDQDLAERGGKLLKAGDLDGFADLAYQRKGLFAVVCRAMVERWNSSNLDDIKERVGVTASAQINRLRFPVRLLNVISVAAPLLGLLGTIVGMVIVFEGVAATTGAAKASILAAGIRVKLFSTAFALIVAIPALFSFFFFNSYLNSVIAEVEVLSERFLHRIAVLKRKGVELSGGTTEDEDADEADDAHDDEAASAEIEDEPAPASPRPTRGEPTRDDRPLQSPAKR